MKLFRINKTVLSLAVLTALVSQSAMAVNIDGGPGNDNITGTEQADFIRGAGGDDNLDGLGGDDRLFGGDGNDTIDGGAGNDEVVGDDGNDRLDGGTGNDIVVGGRGSDLLLGGDGNDLLQGLANDDILIGGAGDDTLQGGTGQDTAAYFNTLGNVSVDLDAGTASSVEGNDTLSNIENVEGSEFSDFLNGNAVNNMLFGNGGNDLILGGGGNDRLEGDAGNDNLSGGSGNDTLFGGTGDDRLFGDAGSDILIGGDGNDLLDGGPGPGRDAADFRNAVNGVTVNLITGIATGEGADTLVNIESISGSNFNDFLTGDAGDNRLDGRGGVDTVSYSGSSGSVGVLLNSGTASGADGNDTLISIENVIGSNFNDIIQGNGFNNKLEGRGGADILSGLGGNDELLGGAGNDTLNGGAGNDTLNGGADNDTFVSGAGSDRLDGGTGIDTVSYEGVSNSVFVNLASGAGNHLVGLDGLNNIENVVGSNFMDVIFGDNNNNVLEGNAGADELNGGAGNDILNGGVGNDMLTGATGIDTTSYQNASGAVQVNLTTGRASGADGNDTLTSIENIIGSNFNDTLTGDAGNNRLDGGEGIDTVIYEDATRSVSVNLFRGIASFAGNDTLLNIENVVGSSFNDALTGDAGNNTLTGGLGNDILNGRAGNDNLDGGIGIDAASYQNASGAVQVNLTTGMASGADGSDTLINIENILGSSFNDTVTGDAGNNVLTGGVSGNDILEGRAGNDTLNGNGGNDTASYQNASGAVQVNLTTGRASGADGNDTLTSIENVIGSDFDDTLTGDSGSNRLDGGAGIDTASYQNASGSVLVDLRAGTAVGADSDNLLNIENVIGSNFNDQLLGDAGDNSFDGGAGIDAVDYRNATGGVQVNLATGMASGADGNDTLINIEDARGTGFDDTLIGDAGDNTLVGFNGNNLYEGGAGNDFLLGAFGNGIDTATYQNADGAVQVNLAAGTATGADGTDRLAGIESAIGSRFDDTLTGAAGANRLNGGLGNDLITGGAGNDELFGGMGNDIFVFSIGDGLDTVFDFEQGDFLDVMGLFPIIEEPVMLFEEASLFVGIPDLFSDGLLSLETLEDFSILSYLDGTSGNFQSFLRLDGFVGQLASSANNQFLIEIVNNDPNVVPAPSAVFLFGTSLFGLVLARRRKWIH